MKKTSLVTGGAGFMGAHVVDELLQRGDTDVIALDDLSGGFRENLNPATTFVEGSILDVALINQLCEGLPIRLYLSSRSLRSGRPESFHQAI